MLDTLLESNPTKLKLLENLVLNIVSKSKGVKLEIPFAYLVYLTYAFTCGRTYAFTLKPVQVGYV